MAVYCVLRDSLVQSKRPGRIVDGRYCALRDSLVQSKRPRKIAG